MCIIMYYIYIYLVGGFNPSEKYGSQLFIGRTFGMMSTKKWPRNSHQTKS